MMCLSSSCAILMNIRIKVVCGCVCTVCVSARVGHCRSHSVLHYTSAVSLRRNAQNLAQISLEAWKHCENVPITWSSYETVSSILYCCIDSQLIVNTISGLSTMSGSIGINFRNDIWWKHFSSSREFKLSLGSWGPMAVCMWDTEVAYICLVWYRILLYSSACGQNVRDTLKERQRSSSGYWVAVRAEIVR